MEIKVLAIAASISTAAATLSAASTLEPAPVIDSPFLIQLNFEGQVATAGGSNDIASPVAIEDQLYIVNQREAQISIRQSDGSLTAAIDTLPDGVTQPNTAGLPTSGIVNIAGQGDKAYVAYYSTTLPPGFGPADPLPADDRYPTQGPRFELIYAYDRADDGSLSGATPLSAFEASTNGHQSGGMLVLPNGDLLYARGDHLRPTFNGLTAPQDTDTSVAKLLLIDPDTGGTEIVGQGLRNVQRLTYTDDTQSQIAFSDIGWQVAEEINLVSVAELLDDAVIENFGWGQNADGFAREGTFYVNDGPEPDAVAIGVAPDDEAGFIQPFAEFGREDRPGFFAVTGPVASSESFDTIGLLFGDLASGDLFATAAGATGTGNDVFNVMVLGADGNPTTVSDFLGTGRDDPRFFNFADNSAGVLFERSGSIFSISQVTQIAPVPLPASGWLFAFALGLAGGVSRLRKGGKSRLSAAS